MGRDYAAARDAEVEKGAKNELWKSECGKRAKKARGWEAFYLINSISSINFSTLIALNPRMKLLRNGFDFIYFRQDLQD